MNKYTYDEPEVFKPRLYKKCELAMMYFPNATKESASRSFRRWLARCTMMMKELEAAYTNRFTSRIIADYVRCLFQGDDIRQKKRMQASQPRRT